MKKLTLTIAAFAAVATTPAFACGMMNQTGATTGSTAAASSMMCGRPAATAVQASPGQPGQQAQQAGGCPCCRNMAMMQPNQSSPGMQGMPGMGGMDHSMPGMQQPNQSPSPQTGPEAPKP